MPNFFDRVLDVVEDELPLASFYQKKNNLGLILGIHELASLPLWEAIADRDEELLAAALMALPRMVEPTSVYNRMAALYFESGQLCEIQDGLAVRRNYNGTEMLLYEVFDLL